VDMRPEAEAKAKAEAKERLIVDILEILKLAEDVQFKLVSMISETEINVAKLVEAERVELEAFRKAAKKRGQQDEEEVEAKWTPANIEAAIDVMQNLSSTMKYIVREVSAIMNLPPEQMERKIATIAPLLREKAKLVAIELRKSDEARPESPYLDEVAQMNDLVRLLMHAEAGAKLEVLLRELRLHDPTLMSVQCHHGLEEDGHVKFSERWGIGDLGAARLAAAVAGMGNARGPNPHVKALYLQGNDITCIGIASIVEGIKSCPQITALNLQGNKIGSEGAASIAGAVKEGRLPLTSF